MENTQQTTEQQTEKTNDPILDQMAKITNEGFDLAEKGKRLFCLNIVKDGEVHDYYVKKKKDAAFVLQYFGKNYPGCKCNVIYGRRIPIKSEIKVSL